MSQCKAPFCSFLITFLICALLMPAVTVSANEMTPNNVVTGIPYYPCYRTVEETYASAASLADTYSNLAEWIDIGDSWEKATPDGNDGYDLMVLKVTNQSSLADKAKIFIVSGLHASDLAPVELNTRFAEYLLANFGTNADITWMLDHTEVHLLLVANPDGRKKAETGLNWRKNTNENYCSPTSNNRGANLNRNFPFHWANPYDKCDDNYAGPNPQSEPETYAIANYILNEFSDQRGPGDNDPAPSNATGLFIDLHSYGGYVYWPYGFDYTSIAPNNAQLKKLAYKFAYFNQYNPLQASEFPASGTSVDFSYGSQGIASFTFEVGTVSNENCTHFETQTYPKNLQALLYAAKVARTPYITPSGPDAVNLSLSAEQTPIDQSFTLTGEINGIHYKNSSEYTENIKAAEYSIDLPPWDDAVITYPMESADGAFDSQVELVTATVQTHGLAFGRHTLYVRGQDQDDTWGAVSAMFFDVDYGIYLPMIYND